MSPHEPQPFTPTHTNAHNTNYRCHANAKMTSTPSSLLLPESSAACPRRTVLRPFLSLPNLHDGSPPQLRCRPLPCRERFWVSVSDRQISRFAKSRNTNTEHDPAPPRTSKSSILVVSPTLRQCQVSMLSASFIFPALLVQELSLVQFFQHRLSLSSLFYFPTCI